MTLLVQVQHDVCAMWLRGIETAVRLRQMFGRQLLGFDCKCVLFLSSTALRSFVAAAILCLTGVSVRMLVLPFCRPPLIVFLGAAFGNGMMSDGDT